MRVEEMKLAALKKEPDRHDKVKDFSKLIP